MPQFDLRNCIKNGDATLRALLIGVNNYEHLQNLSYAENDCEVFSAALQDSAKEFKQPPQFCFHYNRMEHGLTRDAIQTSLHNLKQSASPQDVFLFYFSGHGAISKKTGNLYLCLPETDPRNIDETGLDISSLLDTFNSLNIRHQIVILDACHSGHILPKESRKGSKDTGEYARSIPDSEEPEDDDLKADVTPSLDSALQAYGNKSYQQQRDFYALLSCAPDQVSWELDKQRHGAFTYHLIQGLKEQDAADPDGFITIARLAEYVCKHTSTLVNQSLSKEQTPRKVAFTGLDIVFGKQSLQVQINPKAPLFERENYYRNEYELALRQHYLPMPPDTRRRLDELSRRLGLFEGAQRLEVGLDDHYRSLLDKYKREIQDSIQQDGILSDDKVRSLRQRSGMDDLGFSDGVLRRLEEDVVKPFVDSYRQQYRTALHRYGLGLPMTEIFALDEQKENLNLGWEDARTIAAEEERFLEQNCQRFEEAIARELYSQGEEALTQERIRDHQTTPPLGEIVVNNIIERQRTNFKTTVDELASDIQERLHQIGRLTIEQVQQIQIQSKVGESVIQTIIQREEQALDEHIQQFEQRVRQHLWSTGQLLSEEVEQCQTIPMLGSAIIDPLIDALTRECDQELAKLDQDLFQYLHEYDEGDNLR
ncbi:MAG: caspase family protein [Elainellaceae cyanobacterium]